MSGVLSIVRRVAGQEVARLRTSHLGIVTATFPHEQDDDNNNYEASVRLKHEELELQRVPVAVPFVGVAVPPRVGDLVIVQFLSGDLNHPVITGRFYAEDSANRPPLHKDGELLFEQRFADGKLNQLRFAADGSIFLQRDLTKPEDNSEAKATIKIDGASGNIVIQAGPSLVITLQNDTEIQIECDKTKIKGAVEIEGDVKIAGDLKVENSGGKSTTISGNGITGA